MALHLYLLSILQRFYVSCLLGDLASSVLDSFWVLLDIHMGGGHDLSLFYSQRRESITSVFYWIEGSH